jgi:hypothetical protein
MSLYIGIAVYYTYRVQYQLLSVGISISLMGTTATHLAHLSLVCHTDYV